MSRNYGYEQWRDDLKKILMKAGGEGKPTVFLFTDSQIKDETFVEDINMLLNTGPFYLFTVKILYLFSSKLTVVCTVSHGG
jgi:hypothetical protein